jgi:hypothetical protein
MYFFFSIVCKHTFSKAAIFSLLSRETVISCPIPGCGKHIQRHQLKDDDLMVDRVRRAKAKQQEEQATQVKFDLLYENTRHDTHFLSLFSSLTLSKTNDLWSYLLLLTFY